MDRCLGHVKPGHAAQQKEVGWGDFLSAKHHAEHHRLADDVEKLVPVAFSDRMAVVWVPWRPRGHGHIDWEANPLDDAAHRVLPSQHALFQRGACAKAPVAAKGKADALVSAMVHTDQTGSFT